MRRYQGKVMVGRKEYRISFLSCYRLNSRANVADLKQQILKELGTGGYRAEIIKITEE